MKRKTKNHIKYKKQYISDSDGHNHAPYLVNVEYDDYDSDLDLKLEELAERNSGVETGSGYGGNRDISYDFFTEKGAKQFARKATSRYKRKYRLNVSIMKASINVEYDEYVNF